jgi:hypothetical protein
LLAGEDLMVFRIGREGVSVTSSSDRDQAVYFASSAK